MSRNGKEVGSRFGGPLGIGTVTTAYQGYNFIECWMGNFLLITKLTFKSYHDEANHFQ